MIVATDVDYGSQGAHVAALAFEAWPDAHACVEQTQACVAGGDYKPGAFFERELPCILPVVADLCARYPVRVVIVDGYVDLGNRAGLGGYLHDALRAQGVHVAVVGVAKNPFRGAPSIAVHRGASKRPLHVSARGIELERAAERVQQMHGPYRMPTLLRRVDQLARRNL